ncbi:MAG TPA: serine/threonine-protein kinase [Gemmatimonadales bacterium]|nr:serine/threonine-protein kinase [Gemmatimonadales bacterium]
MPEATYLPPGALLQDRYEIGREIGRGGYSVVYQARDQRVGSDVAIKLLVPPPAAARLARERLRREVQAVRRLSHPNIVTVYDVADDGPWSFVILEYVAGPDLAVRVRQRGPLDPDAAARMAREVAAALEAAHRAGILHRDVKPQNVLLAPDGRARLTDFGSARLAGQPTVTRTGGLVGTPAYAAPEVLAGARGDSRADAYSLGMTLYFALVGELPARAGRDEVAGWRGLAQGHHPRERRLDVPGWLDAAVARATAADPDERFPSARLFAAALSPDADVETGAAVVPRGAVCAICGAKDPFSLGVCPRCAGRASGATRTLIFVDGPRRARSGDAVREILADRIGTETSAAGRDAVARGERPLLRVPAEAADRTVEILESHGLVARAETLPPPWRATVPPAIATLGGVVLAGGSVAAFVASAPVLLLASPLVAVGIVSAAAVGRRSPVWNPPRGARGSLPADVERETVRTLAELPEGPARGLLLDLVRRAAVHSPGSGSVGPLVSAGCAAARELAALETHLEAFDAQAEGLADPPAVWLDAVARCERGRDALGQRMLEAVAVLSGAAGEHALQSASPGEVLATLARDLDAEGRLQAEAAREVEALLAR